MSESPADTGAVSLALGGLEIAFVPRCGIALAPPRWEYPPFLHARGTQQRIGVSVHADESVLEAPRAPVAFDTGDAWRLTVDADGTHQFWSQSPDARVLWQLTSRSPFDAWQLHAPLPDDGSRRLRNLVQYPLDQIVASHALYTRGGLLLHAAGACVDGLAIAFPGVSGAGKSTLSRALIAARAVAPLSDDRIIVRAHGDAFQAHGTPWAGDARIASAAQAPLAALAFLVKAEQASLRQLPPAQALTRLLPVSTLAWYERPLLETGFATVERLIERVPCYELAFPENGAGVLELLRSRITDRATG